MSRISWCIPVLLVAGLSACDQGAQLAQQAASSALAIVGDEVKTQANAVIEQTVGEANQVLAPLGIDASQVAGAIKQTTGVVINQALMPSSEWQQLNDYTGKTIAEIGLLTAVSPIHAELQAVLGNDFAALNAALAGSSILKQEKVLYVIGQGSWLAIDSANRKLDVGLLKNGKWQTYSSKGEAIYRPSDISAMLAKSK